MGSAKHEMERREELRAEAERLLLDAGALTNDCPHETIVWNNDDDALEDAISQVADPELQQAMRDVYRDSAMVCGACDKNAED